MKAPRKSACLLCSEGKEERAVDAFSSKNRASERLHMTEWTLCLQIHLSSSDSGFLTGEDSLFSPSLLNKPLRFIVFMTLISSVSLLLLSWEIQHVLACIDSEHRLRTSPKIDYVYVRCHSTYDWCQQQLSVTAACPQLPASTDHWGFLCHGLSINLCECHRDLEFMKEKLFSVRGPRCRADTFIDQKVLN